MCLRKQRRKIRAAYVTCGAYLVNSERLPEARIYQPQLPAQAWRNFSAARDCRIDRRRVRRGILLRVSPRVLRTSLADSPAFCPAIRALCPKTARISAQIRLRLYRQASKAPGRRGRTGAETPIHALAAEKVRVEQYYKHFKQAVGNGDVVVRLVYEI